MLKGIIAAFFWGCLSVFAYADAAPQTQKTYPMLWEIKTQPPSWVFGTIHLPDPRVENLPAEVNAAFKQSDAVYTEIPLSQETVLQSSRYLFRKDGKKLSEILPEALLKRSEAYLVSLAPGLDISAFEDMKTWAFYSTLVTLKNQLKYPGMKALDMRLYQNAKSQGKEVGGIETIDEQMGYFAAFTEDEQILMLKESLDLIDEMKAKGEDMEEQLFQWYIKGDVDGFYSLMDRLSSPDSDEQLKAKFIKILLSNRNTIMAERIVEKLKEDEGKSYFFAVGAGHLSGDDSVLAQLKKVGFDVKRDVSVR